VANAQGCALRGQQAFWQQELPRFGYELGAMTEMSLELFALLHGNGTVMMDTGPDMQRGLDHYRNYEMNPVGQVCVRFGPSHHRLHLDGTRGNVALHLH